MKDSDSELLLSGAHGLHSVKHILDEVDFRATKSAEVGNIVRAVVRFGVFSVNTADLDVVLVSDCLELVFFPGQFWKLDVHGSAHSSSKIGWARSDVAEMFVIGELSLLFDHSRGD